MKSKSVLITGMLLFAALLVLAGNAPPVVAQQETSLILDPASLPLSPGATGTSTVKVTGAANVYGIQFTITFDPSLVQVVDADPQTTGVQIGFPQGTYFEGKDYFIGRNWVDNALGQIDLAVTLHQPALPINGDAVIAKITWRASAAGWSSVQFPAAKLVDKDGNPLPCTPTGGRVGSDARPPIDGRVKLQGRPDSWLKDTLVVLSEEPCLPSAPTRLDDPTDMREINIIPDMPYTYTDEHGSFRIVPYADHDYRCLVVFHHGYMTGQAALPRGGFPAAHDLGTITLPGGDVNEDDVVNIFDLVKVASHMRPGPYDETADINLDRLIDITDLAITAGNFGFRGPLADWQ